MQPVNAMKAPSPTAEVYGELCTAYDFYNRALFDNGLPLCLITLQRKGKVTYGYFYPERFRRHSGESTDEIAMNPAHFSARSLVEVMQTLVHEMSHLWQQHFGSPGRRGYHNIAWGTKLNWICRVVGRGSRACGRSQR
jgi:hypothetical protein